MRIAVIADIHGLLHPLEVALEEIAGEDVVGIIVAGDMVAGPQPMDVITRLREHQCWMIRGNNEDYILQYATGKAPDWWYTCQQMAFIRWNYDNLDEQTIDFLRSLPEQRTISLPGTEAVRVVHGSPRDNFELIYPDKDISLLDSALEQISESIAVFGHSHEAWQTLRNGKLAVNPGSLSMAFHGNQCGSYAVLQWESDHWTAEIRDLFYSGETVRKAYKETGLLEEGGAYARCCLVSIETGINHLSPMLEFAFQKAEEAGYADFPFVPDDIWEEATKLFEETHYKGMP